MNDLLILTAKVAEAVANMTANVTEVLSYNGLYLFERGAFYEFF